MFRNPRLANTYELIANKGRDEFYKGSIAKTIDAHMAEHGGLLNYDDMAAHIRSVLTQTEISVPIRQGRLALGTWQGLFLWEHRYQAHRRRLTVTLQG